MEKITPDIVEKYYNDNFDKLSKEKQFHFASRLFLFTDKKEYEEKIIKLRSYYSWKNELVEEMVNAEIDRAHFHLKKIVNKKPFRQKSVEKYPLIGVFNHILFKALFHKTIYRIDLIEKIKFHDCTKEMKKYFDQLSKDQESIFLLSTHAINFLFLFKEFFGDKIHIENIAEITKTDHGLGQSNSLQASIYLLTHIIICESLFYARKPTSSLTACVKIFRDVHELIERNYDKISLDQKLEFLVCGIILEQGTDLRERILDEASRSKSPDGNFIIDQLNEKKGIEHLQTFEGSEHRNVLYIMTNC